MLAALAPRAQGLPTKKGGAASDEIVAAAAKWGDAAIPLCSGDPDLPTPLHVSAAVIDALQRDESEKTIHYESGPGMLALREAISGHMASSYGLEYPPDDIAVTQGVQMGLTACFLALCSEGDEVLFAAPGYGYGSQASLAGATPVEVPVRADTDFIMTAEAVEAKITPRSKILCQCSPLNPSGAVTPPHVVEELAALAIKHDLLVISDEIYSDMMFDEHSHVSIASFPGMRERTVVLRGCSKSYAMTGWRIGYIAGPPGFAQIATAVGGHMALSVSAVSQYAAMAVFNGPQEVVAEYNAIDAESRKYMKRRLHAMGFTTYGCVCAGVGGCVYIAAFVACDANSGRSRCVAVQRARGLHDAGARPLLAPNSVTKRTICQYRLGTNTRKPQQSFGVVFLGRHGLRTRPPASG
jgi:aminotransferase